MARRLALVVLAAGCYGDGEGFEVYLADGPIPCVLVDECPLAVGGTARVDVLHYISDTASYDDRFVAVVDDPAVLGLARAPDGLELTGLAEGDATLRLEHLEEPMTFSVRVHVAPIARSEIVPGDARFGVATSDPLLVLRDSRIALEARHFDAADHLLVGRGLDAWALSGATGATLVGDLGARSHELGAHDAESFTITTGPASLGVSVVGPGAVDTIELRATAGRSDVARENTILRIKGRYSATLHVAAYDAAGAYIAGGGRAEDFNASGEGVFALDRVRRQVLVDGVEADLEVQVGAASGSFGVVFR